jgi:hypothetical protein
MDTVISAAVCEAADPPITVRPGKAHITKRRCADLSDIDTGRTGTAAAVQT